VGDGVEIWIGDRDSLDPDFSTMVNFTAILSIIDKGKKYPNDIWFLYFLSFQVELSWVGLGVEKRKMLCLNSSF